MTAKVIYSCRAGGFACLENRPRACQNAAWQRCGSASFGSALSKLLESIRDTGSISAAAREMGMSYKRAWVLLDSINQAFAEPVVTVEQGAAARS